MTRVPTIGIVVAIRTCVHSYTHTDLFPRITPIGTTTSMTQQVTAEYSILCHTHTYVYIFLQTILSSQSHLDWFFFLGTFHRFVHHPFVRSFVLRKTTTHHDNPPAVAWGG